MKMLVNASKGLSLMTVKDCRLRNKLVHVNTNKMLHDIPQEQHGGLEPENIFDCRERYPLVLTT